MKKSYLLLILLVTSVETYYSQKEKNLAHPFPKIYDWESTIKKATAENKFIMVDLSTEWCGPCKIMEKKNFADPEVLSLMQPKLNSYILDAETDSIGQLLKLKYGVCAYPSFLFFTPQGEYLETWCGAMPKEYWVQYVRDSIDTEPMARPGIPAGLHFEWPDFVQRELKAKFKNSTPKNEELKRFFEQCDYTNFVDFNVCRFYPRNIPDSLLNLMIQDKGLISGKFGKDITTDMLSTSINWKTYYEVEQENWSNARSYMNQYASNFPQFEWELFNAKLFYFEMKMEVDSLIDLGVKNPDFVSEHIAIMLVDFISKNGKTKSHFEQAIQWNKEEMEQEEQFVFAKYQALLSYKMSDLAESKKWISIAKDLARKEGIDLKSETEFKWLIDTIESTKG
jgi:thioredoxin-related protein